MDDNKLTTSIAYAPNAYTTYPTEAQCAEQFAAVARLATRQLVIPATQGATMLGMSVLSTSSCQNGLLAVLTPPRKISFQEGLPWDSRMRRPLRVRPGSDDGVGTD